MKRRVRFDELSHDMTGKAWRRLASPKRGAERGCKAPECKNCGEMRPDCASRRPRGRVAEVRELPFVRADVAGNRGERCGLVKNPRASHVRADPDDDPERDLECQGASEVRIFVGHRRQGRMQDYWATFESSRRRSA